MPFCNVPDPFSWPKSSLLIRYWSLFIGSESNSIQFHNFFIKSELISFKVVIQIFPTCIIEYLMPVTYLILGETCNFSYYGLQNVLWKCSIEQIDISPQLIFTRDQRFNIVASLFDIYFYDSCTFSFQNILDALYLHF